MSTSTRRGSPRRPTRTTLEAFDTFEENALAKARYFYERERRYPDASPTTRGSRSTRSAARRACAASAGAGATTSTGGARRGEQRGACSTRSRGVRDAARARYVCAAACVDGGARARRARRGRRARSCDEPRGDGRVRLRSATFCRDELGTTFGEATRGGEGAGESSRARVSRACSRAYASRGALTRR